MLKIRLKLQCSTPIGITANALNFLHFDQQYIRLRMLLMGIAYKREFSTMY